MRPTALSFAPPAARFFLSDVLALAEDEDAAMADADAGERRPVAVAAAAASADFASEEVADVDEEEVAEELPMDVGVGGTSVASVLLRRRFSSSMASGERK